MGARAPTCAPARPRSIAMRLMKGTSAARNGVAAHVLASGVHGSVTTTGPPERLAQDALDARRNRGAHVDERARGAMEVRHRGSLRKNLVRVGDESLSAPPPQGRRHAVGRTKTITSDRIHGS